MLPSAFSNDRARAILASDFSKAAEYIILMPVRMLNVSYDGLVNIYAVKKLPLELRNTLAFEIFPTFLKESNIRDPKWRSKLFDRLAEKYDSEEMKFCISVMEGIVARNHLEPKDF